MAGKRSKFAYLYLLLVFGIFFPKSTLLAESDAKFAVSSAFPETIDQVIAKVEIAEPELFSKKYLLDAKDYFIESTSFYSDKERIERTAFTLYGQWIYLELFKAYRLEYLMLSLAKSLAISHYSDIVSEFQRNLPETYFENLPRLQKKRTELIVALQNLKNSPEKLREGKEFVLGVLESAYLSLQILNTKEEYVKSRYDTEDKFYDSELENIEKIRNNVVHSSAILNTESFKKNVEPFYKKETVETSLLTEKAVNNFQNKLNKRLTDKSSLKKLADLITGSQMIELKSKLAVALQSNQATKFRARIAKAFPDAIKEVSKHQKDTLLEFNQKFVQNNYKEKLVISNTRSSEKNYDFHNHLLTLFMEQPLHWIITERHPYLQSAAEDLTNFANNERSRQKLQNVKLYSLATAVLTFMPLGRSGNKFSDWLGPKQLKWIRRGFVLAETAVVGALAKNVVTSYMDYKNIYRLSRINTQGMGLMTLVQEDSAYWGVVRQALVTGAAGAMSFIYNVKFWNKAMNVNTGKYSLGDVAGLTWNGSPLALKDIRVALNSSIKGLQKSVRALDVKASYMHLRAVGFELSTIMTQMITMVPAAMPTKVKSLLQTIPKSIYQGITLGTVMTVSGVTTQTYITAASLKAFVWAFDKLGFEPPAYWKQSTINAPTKVRRDAFLTIQLELTTAVTEINKFVGFIAQWEHMLSREDVPADTRMELEQAIVSARESIEYHLKLNLMRWYFRFEYREIANSALKDKGFAILASPNYDSPARMTIIYQTGKRTFSYQATGKFLDELKDRNVLPELEVETSTQSVKDLLKTLLPTESD